MFKNDKGMAMPAALIAMLIVVLLGAALLQVAIADSLHAARDRNRMQAYYLARSGVEATEKWIMENASNINQINNKTSEATSIPESGINGTFVVKVSGDLDNIILVEATGTVNNVNAKVTKALISSGDILSNPVFDDTVYAKSLVTLNGNVEIDGTVAYGESLELNGKSLTITGGDPEQKNKELPPPNFTYDPSTAPELPGGLAKNLILNDLPGFGSLSSRTLVVRSFDLNNYNITVNTTGTTDVVRLYTTSFDIGPGSLTITGGGRFELYVTESMGIDGNSEHNEAGTAKQFFVLMGEGSNLVMTGEPTFHGVIYGPQANMTISGDSGFEGAVVGGNVTLKGDPFTSSGDSGDITFNDLPITIISDSNYINN